MNTLHQNCRSRVAGRRSLHRRRAKVPVQGPEHPDDPWRIIAEISTAGVQVCFPQFRVGNRSIVCPVKRRNN